MQSSNADAPRDARTFRRNASPGSRKTLSRGEILKGRTLIREVLSVRPEYFASFMVHFRKAPRRRAGFFVAKKLGNAVERNLAKRRMREIYRQMKDDFPQGEIIFRIKKQAGWDELCKDFESCAQRLARRDS